MNSHSNLVAKHQGLDVYVFTLTNERGMTVKLSNYGGLIQSIMVPNKEGKPVDVVLGFDSIPEYWSEEYLNNYPYFGVIIGRYANRIAQGKCWVDGKSYQLTTNAGEHQLHGGHAGFDKKVWDVISSTDVEVVLHYHSKHGEEGFPGNLNIQLRFQLAETNELFISMTAQTDQATPINLTHHGYFNLEGSGHIGAHVMQICANTCLGQNADFVPTGQENMVADTFYDFRTPKAIASNWNAAEGYDQTFVLTSTETNTAAASVYAPQSGICMDLYTNQPAIQFYTAKHLAPMKGKNGLDYGPFTAFCLEDQVHPDAVNHAHFPNTILRPGETYTHQTRYAFSVRA